MVGCGSSLTNITIYLVSRKFGNPMDVASHEWE